MAEALQTLGICVGAAALVVIAFSMFLIASTLSSVPSMPGDWDDEDEDDDVYDASWEEFHKKRRAQREKDA